MFNWSQISSATDIFYYVLSLFSSISYLVFVASCAKQYVHTLASEQDYF